MLPLIELRRNEPKSGASGLAGIAGGRRRRALRCELARFVEARRSAFPRGGQTARREARATRRGALRERARSTGSRLNLPEGRTDLALTQGRARFALRNRILGQETRRIADVADGSGRVAKVNSAPGAGEQMRPQSHLWCKQEETGRPASITGRCLAQSAENRDVFRVRQDRQDPDDIRLRFPARPAAGRDRGGRPRE